MAVLKNAQLAGLILAGGEGKRWGGPKAWAKLPDGRTFLEACAKTLTDAGALPVVATLPPGTDAPEIEGLNAVALPEPGMDMFGSLRTGLGRLMQNDAWGKVAVLPVDHPLVTSEAVAILSRTEAAAAIPSFRGKHGHPVCLARTVVKKIGSGELSGPTLREVLKFVGAVDVSVNDVGVVSNCNTPEALREALTQLDAVRRRASRKAATDV